LESSDEGDGSDGDANLTRAALKALDREIPWRMISEAEVDAFTEAIAKEWKEWLRWGAVRPATQAELRNIRKSHVLPSRVGYRWKPIPQGRKAKARIVVQGFRDPHLPLLARDSPVLTRAGLFCLLQTCCSNFKHPDGVWLLFSSDCSSAFLQGGAAPDRPAQIFMRVPTDPLAKKGCKFEASIYAIVGSVYGLCNSPRLWFAEVRRRLLAIG
jgi:hypothetical protein